MWGTITDLLLGFGMLAQYAQIRILSKQNKVLSQAVEETFKLADEKLDELADAVNANADVLIEQVDAWVDFQNELNKIK